MVVVTLVGFEIVAVPLTTDHDPEPDDGVLPVSVNVPLPHFD